MQQPIEITMKNGKKTTVLAEGYGNSDELWWLECYDQSTGTIIPEEMYDTLLAEREFIKEATNG